MTPQERTLITRVITRDKCSQTQDEVCSEETVKVDGRQILSQAECKKQFQLICRAVRQFKAITRATEYIRRAFNEIKREFLSVIDHLETEAEEKYPRKRRENNEKVQEELKIAYSRVSKEELEVLDDILKQVEKKYPDLNEKVLKRTKRFGVMSWIMGWGVYSNWRQIKAIKKNIKKLYEQNLLQEQQIQDLACCNMDQSDTIGKIELFPSIVLSSDNTDCKNDIQLFPQLFDELSVHTDYH